MKNINTLNIVLLTGAFFFAFYLFFPALDITAGFTLPSVTKSVAEKEETGMEIRIPSVTEYTKITEENLFHPERKIPVEKKSDQQQPLPKPEFVLYGILITDDLRLAYIEDLKAPRNSLGRGKRQTALKKGDTLSGFTLKEIEADQIVMARGEESITVKVLGDTAKKERSIQTTTQVKEAPPAIPPQKPRDTTRRRITPTQPK
jgi:type II secretory pathway component PulC